MATPKFLVSQIPANLLAAGNQVVRVNTFAPDGSPLDVSSGFTIHSANAIPAQDRNPNDSSNIDLTSYFTPTFDATGVSLLVENQGLAQAMTTLHAVCTLTLTNDAGSTRSTAAIINIALSPVIVEG